MANLSQERAGTDEEKGHPMTADPDTAIQIRIASENDADLHD